MKVLRDIRSALWAILEPFLVSDMDVVSSEARRIMANPDDRKIYIDAVEKLKSGEVDRITIQLSTGPITIY